MEQIKDRSIFRKDVSSEDFLSDKQNVFNALCKASKDLKKATSNLRHSACITILFVALATFSFFKIGIENPVGIAINSAMVSMMIASAVLIMKFYATFSFQKHIYNIIYAGYIIIFPEEGKEKEFIENIDSKLKTCSEK